MKKQIEINYNGIELLVICDYERPDNSQGYNGYLDIAEIYYNDIEITEIIDNFGGMEKIDILTWEEILENYE